MRLFIGGQLVNYSDTRDELILQILEHSINGPQKIPLAFFRAYFMNGGSREHPILGDLEEVMLEINLSWNQTRGGVNLVSSLLEHKLRELVPIAQITP